MIFSPHYPVLAAWPREINYNPILEDGPGGSSFDGGTFDSGSTSPTPTPTTPPPAIPIPEQVAGGQTPQQVDLAARLETQEGVDLPILFGDLLIAGTMVSHKYTVGPPKKNEFTVWLGEGWGGRGGRGEFDQIKKAWYAGEELDSTYSFEIWVEDRIPPGATAVADTDGWNWVNANPLPFFGKYAHQSPNKSGIHQHYFAGASPGLAIQSGDNLTCFIYLDPVNTPATVMLQFHIGADLEHRAYWGANNIPFGTNGTPSRFQVSPTLPATGQWVRLDVAASDVDLEGETIDGVSFTLFNGAATWDQFGRWQDTAGEGYRFSPGYISQQFIEVQQGGADAFPMGTSGSGTALVYVRLTEDQSERDEPEKFKCRVLARRTRNYDATGQELIEEYGYSANPARVAADRMLHFFERRFPDRLDLAEQKFRARVHWPSWVRWRDYCDELIPWDKEGNGVSVFIPRFEFHGGFTTAILLADVLDQLTGVSASRWQDDGEQIRFLLPTDIEPVHHLHPGNLKEAPGFSFQDLRELPNRFIGSGRDLDDEFLGLINIEPPDNTEEARLREDAINRVGEIRSERQFTNMTQSQMQRLLFYRAQLEFHNSTYCSLVALAPALKVLAGDFVTLSHTVLNLTYQLCMVIDVTLRTAESSPDEVEMTLQLINGPLYSDTAHSPRQEALTL